MPPKKSKTLRKSLNKSNAERHWSGENVNFGAILDGGNEFIRACTTLQLTAPAATVQSMIAALEPLY